MRIKTVIIFTILCIPVLSLYAQKSDRFNEFGSQKRLRLNIYLGPLIAFSSVEGNFSIDMGATGGFIINEDFFAGIYGQKLRNNPPREDLANIGLPTYSDGEIEMIHAGGVLGYMHKPGKVLHWGISGSAGVGILTLSATEPKYLSREKVYDDKVYIVIPKLFAELNVTKWLKVNASAGYRFLGKVSSFYVNQDKEKILIFNKSDYNKPEFSVALFFGAFEIRRGILN